MKYIISLVYGLMLSVNGIAADSNRQLITPTDIEQMEIIIAEIQKKLEVKLTIFGASDVLFNLAEVIKKILKENFEAKNKTGEYDINIIKDFVATVKKINGESTFGRDKSIDISADAFEEDFKNAISSLKELLKVLPDGDKKEDENKLREQFFALKEKLIKAKTAVPLPKSFIVSLHKPQASQLLLKGYELLIFLAEQAGRKSLDLILFTVDNSVKKELIGEEKLGLAPQFFKDPTTFPELWKNLWTLVRYGNLHLLLANSAECEAVINAYKNKNAAFLDTHTDKKCIDNEYPEYCKSLMEIRFNIVTTCFR